MVGSDIDTGEEIAKGLGVKMEWQPTDWDGTVAVLYLALTSIFTFLVGYLEKKFALPE